MVARLQSQNSLTVGDALWPSDNGYDVPVLLDDLAARSVDAPVVGWGTSGRSTKMRGTWHFFVDDYRFTALLKRPHQLPATNAVAAVEPNFTITDQMPYAEALHRVYQKRWIARYWQSVGIKIIVDLNVSQRYAKLNLTGVPHGWPSYATRGHNDRLHQIIKEYELAKAHAGAPPLFVVYGGGRRVSDLCRARHWLWFSEQNKRETL